MKFLSVVGARPQFVKLAPMDRAIGRHHHQHVIVHTGQHYDRLLSRAFFDDLGIRPPAVNLGVGSARPAAQTAAILAGLEPVLAEHQPDWVLVYGDTNSTLGGALAAAQGGVPLAHLEAGLRSYDRRMAEERNRVVTDHVADLLLAPTAAAMRNLAAEGLSARSLLVGDIMVEELQAVRARVMAAPDRYLPSFARSGPFLLATVHRAENTDEPHRLAAFLKALAACPLPVYLLTHPRLADRARRAGLPLSAGRLHACEPLPYPAMIAALTAASGLVTDSGGLQKEALLLGVPATTLRAETEWPETRQGDWNVLVPDPGDLVAAVSRPRPAGPPPAPFGDGGTGDRVVAALTVQPHPRSVREDPAA